MKNSENIKQGGLGYILDMAYSYCKSKVLFVATDIGVFSVLTRSKKNAQKIAQELELETRPIEMLLNACVSLGLVDKKDGLYFNSPSAELFLVKGKPMYVGEAFNVLDKRSYKLWDRLNDAVKTNNPQAYEEGGGDLFEEMTKSEEEMYAFFQGLHTLAYWPALSLSQTFNFAPYHHLLDVGGGSGAYSIAIIKKHKHLNSTIFDLPQVCEIARKFVAKENLSQKITTHPGDFFKDDFPQDVDLILFSNVLHDWKETKIQDLLKRSFEYLPSRGGIIISDMVLDNNGTAPLYAAMMSLTLLMETQGGSNYTEKQYTQWLERAGFREICTKTLTGPNKIVAAIKP